jgi:hypothetical protein
MECDEQTIWFNFNLKWNLIIVYVFMGSAIVVLIWSN